MTVESPLFADLRQSPAERDRDADPLSDYARNTEPNALARRLRTVTRLSAKDRDCLDWLCASTRRFRPGDRLMQQGETTQDVFVMLSGWAQRHKTLPDGQRQVFAYLLPGDLSDMHAPTLGLADHGITAMTDAEVAIVPRDKMLATIERHPAIAKAFIWAMVVEKSILRDWLLNVSRREAYERIAHLFCELHARLDLVGLVDGDSFALPVTQEQLGESTAMSTVHVNRVLRRLRGDRLIEIGKRRLRILDLERLRDCAKFDNSYLDFANEGWSG